MSNFLNIQARIEGLLKAVPAFAAVPIITEVVADLQSEIAKQILQADGFGFVITASSGDRDEGAKPELVLNDLVTIAIIQVPVLAPTAGPLVALDTIIRTLHGQPASTELTRATRTGHDLILFSGWAVANNSPEGVATWHVTFKVPNRFAGLQVRGL